MMRGCEEKQKEEPEERREQPIPGCERYKRKMCVRYVKEETMETRRGYREVCVCAFFSRVASFILPYHKNPRSYYERGDNERDMAHSFFFPWQAAEEKTNKKDYRKTSMCAFVFINVLHFYFTIIYSIL